VKITNTLINSIFAITFLQQKKFIQDPSKRKALFVPRRGAKTFAIAVYMLMAALSNNNVKIMYLGLSKESAENALWKDCLYNLFTTLRFVEGVDYTYNRVTKTAVFSNKSSIKMTGADTSFKEPAKLLGGKYFMAVIDECQNYTNDLESIVNTVLGPAVSDFILKGGGQIILAGTAGPYIGKHYWYQVNHNKSLGWSIHSWEGKDNPHMKAAKEQEEKDFLKRYGEDYKLTDWYRQQYLNEWLEDSIDRVYMFSREKNVVSDPVLIAKLNDGLIPSMKYVLATDLGSNNATSFTLLGYSKYDPVNYIIKSEKFVGIDLDKLVSKLMEYKNKYKIVYWPIDSAGAIKIVVDDYRSKYNIPFTYPKSKTDKLEYQRLFNSDLVCSRIKVVASQCAPLIEEWNELLWDKKALAEGYRKEADRYNNDCADSALYSYAEAHHHRAKEEPAMPDANTAAVKSFIELANKRTNILNSNKDFTSW
jgi:hypothetical protein